MKNFAVTLYDLPGSPTEARAFYEGSHLYTVEDENGRSWELKELSIADLAEIHRHHVLKLEDDNSNDCASMDEYLDAHGLTRFG